MDIIKSQKKFEPVIKNTSFNYLPGGIYFNENNTTLPYQHSL